MHLERYCDENGQWEDQRGLQGDKLVTVAYLRTTEATKAAALAKIEVD